MKKRILLLHLLILSYTLHAQDEMYHYKTLKKHSETINDIAFSPDSKYLLSGSDDKTMLLWDIEEEEVIQTFPGYHNKIRSVSFLQNGELMLAALGKNLKIYNKEGETMATLAGHGTFIWTFQLSKDEKYCVSGSMDPSFWYWDLKEKKSIKEFKGHDESAMAVAISADGKHIASGSRDRKIKIWNTDSLKEIKSFEAHTDNIYSLAFTHNGKYLLSASRDGTIKLWDVATGEKIKTYASHKKAVMSVAISPDDRQFLSASLDGTIRCWELSDGKSLYTFIDHEGPVNAVKFSSDAKYFASCSSDNTIIIWKYKKRIVSEYYFSDEIQKEIDASNLFDPKRKGEKKDEYNTRMEKAEAKRNELYEKYYKKYLETVPAEPQKQAGEY